jgi:hypothetical protein
LDHVAADLDHYLVSRAVMGVGGEGDVHGAKMGEKAGAGMEVG